MKSVKIFGKSVPLLAVVMISMLVIGASAYAFVGVASASPGTLTLYYYTDNKRGDDSGVAVTGLSVYVKTIGGADVASKGGVSGSVTFTLPTGDYKVVSVKGASSRTDPATVSSDIPVNIPCGKLIVNYNTENDGTATSSGGGTDVAGLSVYVKTTAMGDVASAGGVSGSTSFALLAGDYKVVSVKGASTRTDGPYTVASDATADIPCGKLIVTYYANNNALWGMTGVSVYVKWAADNGAVDQRGGVSGSTSFALLAGNYKVDSVKGASSRTGDGPYTVASDATADIPVARFRVAVVTGGFTAQTGVSVYVKWAADNGAVDQRGGVSGSTDFSLLQSSGTGGTIGAGAYTFIATKNSTTAQTTANADEVPPAGLSGVILMIP